MFGFEVQIVLRERNEAVSRQLHHHGNRPAEWTPADVEEVLKAILREIDHVRSPRAEDEQNRFVALRGFSWIVEPTPEGVVIAIEIPSGAAVAGPFDIPQERLDVMIRRVLADAAPRRPTVH